MNMDESIQVASINDKLLPIRRDVKKNLKHQKEDMFLKELGKHLLIKEQCRLENKTNKDTSKVHVAEKEGDSSKAREKRKHKDDKAKDKFKKNKKDVNTSRRKSLSSLAVNVKNFDGKLLGKVRKPMKARCCVFFKEPGANQANPDGITIMIMKDNCDVMNAANTGLGDNSIPKVFYTSNWVHNEPLKAMKILMHLMWILNVTTNPKVAPNKLLNKEGVQVGIDVESDGAQSFYYFWCVNKKVGVDGCCKGVNTRHNDTGMGHSKSVKAKDGLCTNITGVMVEIEQPGTTCRMVLGSYEPVTHGHIMNEGGNVCLGMSKLGSSASYSGSIPTGLVDKSLDSTCADICCTKSMDNAVFAYSC
uniref:Uncharacterized protein n=1 Tax=Tanacetum cinerariifolium TaxID=118510 RepID=A0A6L2KBF8_TANCI|nr:hypothetical protein [Tanacetum cinerariifolium]